MLTVENLKSSTQLWKFRLQSQVNLKIRSSHHFFLPKIIPCPWSLPKMQNKLEMLWLENNIKTWILKISKMVLQENCTWIIFQLIPLYRFKSLDFVRCCWQTLKINVIIHGIDKVCESDRGTYKSFQCSKELLIDKGEPWIDPLEIRSWFRNKIMTVISSWKWRRTFLSILLRSEYRISRFLAASCKATLISLLALP